MPVATLLEIARRHGTPAYAYDLSRLRTQADKLRTHLPDAVEIFYSLKANASLGLCDVLAEEGLGADVASAGELVTVVEAGFPAERIFVAGPYKSPETIALLRTLPEAIVSADSRSELQSLGREELPNPVVIRLRPDFQSSAAVTAGPDCRFGITADELPGCGREAASLGLDVIGFHIFAGSQVLEAGGVIEHLRGSVELSLRAADVLGITPEFFNLGGGFGIPYRAGDEELELTRIGEELESLLQRAAPARLALELGRYLVAQAGWYLTSVVGHQAYGDCRSVVVDGGTHQRADLCGLGLRCNADPPLALDAASSALEPTNVLGCLSLPADVMAEGSLLPALSPGNILAFANAGAYGLWSSPVLFHGYTMPAEIAFDGSEITVMRHAQPAARILDEQHHVAKTETPSTLCQT